MILRTKVWKNTYPGIL